MVAPDVQDTIFALSSGAPPAAVALIRISGPAARTALCRLAGRVPVPRRATYVALRDAQGELLDRALVIWLPGPQSATGEDTAELHCHGGRAVVAAVETALAAMPELRRATAGEFTRRAFVNGKIDLAQAEGLADLLTAETELQRRGAIAMAGGALSRRIEAWRAGLLQASAMIEADLDFADEDDTTILPPRFGEQIAALAGEIREWLVRPRAELLRDGLRVVLAGPPNAGKSTLFNALVEHEAAITAPTPGTTRDVLTYPIALTGAPFVIVDTAGLRETADAVEAMGVDRAHQAIETGDVVLWLGPEGDGPLGAWEIAAQCDRVDRLHKEAPRHEVSARTGQGLDALRSDLAAEATKAMVTSEGTVNQRQRILLEQAAADLNAMPRLKEALLIAEHLRQARLSFDALLGRTATEDMLDVLFGRFCIGK